MKGGVWWREEKREDKSKEEGRRFRIWRWAEALKIADYQSDKVQY